MVYLVLLWGSEDLSGPSGHHVSDSEL